MPQTQFRIVLTNETYTDQKRGAISMNKLKRYILKPYEIRRTMCRIRLVWLLRKNIMLEFRMARIESQDEYRIWINYTIPAIMNSFTDIYISVLEAMRDTLTDTTS